MYSLLVVDDEPLITDGICDLFVNSNVPDLDVYAAYSGAEALRWMEKTKIDIVITDISMPGMSGLEVQSRIKQLWPSCKVIILTGYDDFNYIRSAMRHDGIDYILKTEGEEAVIRAVQSAVEKIEEESRKEKLLEQARIRMSMALPVLQTKYLKDLAEGWEIWGKETERQLAELDLPFNLKRPILLLAGQVDYWPKKISKTQKLKQVYGVKDTVEKYLQKYANVISAVFEQTKMLWFIQPVPTRSAEGGRAKDGEKKGGGSEDGRTKNGGTEEDDSMRRCLVTVKGYMGSIQDMCKDIYQISVSFALSSRPVEWNEISLNYESLNMKLSNEAGLSNEMLLIDEGRENLFVENRINFEKDAVIRTQVRKLSLLKTYLENGDRESFFSLYRSIMEQVGKNADGNNDVCTEVFFSLAVLFLSHMNRCNLMGEIGSRMDLDKLTNPERFSSWGEVICYFSNLAEKLMEQKGFDNFTKTDRIFRFIKTYIDQHIADDLSLARFADLLHYHPCYLSRLFRQVTGTSLTKYVQQCKVKKAKERLKNSNEKINEVASSLGFQTASYFTSFFKHYTGLTPVEYRNQHFFKVKGDGTRRMNHF